MAENTFQKSSITVEGACKRRKPFSRRARIARSCRVRSLPILVGVRSFILACQR
jgi:hypothetical protein